MAESKPAPSSDDKPIEEQAREQTGQRQVRLRVDEREMSTSYANAFRTNGTAEEVMVDFGLNLVGPTQEKDQPEIIFTINDRSLLNSYSATRLAIQLSQCIRRPGGRTGAPALAVGQRRQDGG